MTDAHHHASAFDFSRPAEHDIRIRASSQKQALHAISQALLQSQARLVKLSADSVGVGCVFSMRLNQANVAEAHTIAARIANHAGIDSTHVEHIWRRMTP